MEIIKPVDLLSLLKDKHILLDTNILIDSLTKPRLFKSFFNELRENGVTITSIDPVAIEFLQGASDKKRYGEKKEILSQIIDAFIPINKDIFNNVYKLIEAYGIDGKGTDMTDFLLGAALVQYPERLFLFTKNTGDFPLSVFNLVSVINFPTIKSIQTYGIYKYKT